MMDTMKIYRYQAIIQNVSKQYFCDISNQNFNFTIHIHFTVNIMRQMFTKGFTFLA